MQGVPPSQKSQSSAPPAHSPEPHQSQSPPPSPQPQETQQSPQVSTVMLVLIWLLRVSSFILT